MFERGVSPPPPLSLHKPRLEITKAIIHDPGNSTVKRKRERVRESRARISPSRPRDEAVRGWESRRRFLVLCFSPVHPAAHRLVWMHGQDLDWRREEIKAWGRGEEGRKGCSGGERERERESPLSNGFTRWVRWWNSPLKWFYWRAWGATTSRREGSKVWPTHPRPEERKEGCLSPQPPSSLNLAMFLRGNLENWAKGFRPYPPFAFVLSITGRGGGLWDCRCHSAILRMARWISRVKKGFNSWCKGQ